jgi:hypothetical protein
VQKPGTLVRAGDLAFKTKDHVAVPAESTGVGGLTVAVTVPVFGVGRTLGAGGQRRADDPVERPVRLQPAHPTPSRSWDHDRGAARRSGGHQPAWTGVYLFGGLAQTSINEGPQDQQPAGRVRGGPGGVLQLLPGQHPARRGRRGLPTAKRTVLAATPRPVFAFGGLDAGDNALDTIVSMDVDATPLMPVNPGHQVEDAGAAGGAHRQLGRHQRGLGQTS